MGRRKKKAVRYSEFTESYYLAEVRDDVSLANPAKVKSEADLDKLVKRKQLPLIEEFDGPVSYELKSSQLVTIDAQGKTRVNPTKVVQEAENVKQQVLDARYYGREIYDKQVKEYISQYKVTPKQAENLIAIDYKIKARAILVSANAGKIKIDSYTKGILNSLAAGKYEETVFGKEGAVRRYDKGTYFTKEGFADAKRRKDAGKGFVGAKGTLDEMRANFREITSFRPGSGRDQQRGIRDPGEMRYGALQTGESRYGSKPRVQDKDEARNAVSMYAYKPANDDIPF